MNVNFIDYDVLAEGVKEYNKQAQAILEVVMKIETMNKVMVERGWSNKTAKAFVDRIGTDHIPKLKKASEALQEVSEYIKKYGLDKQDDDAQGASALAR